MSVVWVTDLSDGELLQRLLNVGVRADRAEALVRNRDRDEVVEVVQDLLEAGVR